MAVTIRHPSCRHPISSKEWDALSPNPCVEAGFINETSLEVPGISMVHLVDKSVAFPGDRVFFTVWILNATTETLTDVTLALRSFSNSSLENIQYETQPIERLLKRRTLGPRQSLQYSFSYQITTKDADESGFLISALSADLTSEVMGRLSSECDAFVSVGA